MNPEVPSDLETQLQLLTKLKPTTSLKWGGSITFLQRYISQAFKRLSKGPKELVDPEQEFIQLDIEDYLKYKCKEILPNERYMCEICKKVFKGEDFVLKHIKNKHEDVVNETYEKESTKDWLERNIQ